jgi:hypothetical protein
VPLLCTLSCADSFYGIQLQGSFAIYWLVFLLTLSNGIVLAYFIAAISPNMDVANALLPTYVVTLLFFSGFKQEASPVHGWLSASRSTPAAEGGRASGNWPRQVLRWLYRVMMYLAGIPYGSLVLPLAYLFFDQ